MSDLTTEITLNSNSSEISNKPMTSEIEQPTDKISTEVRLPVLDTAGLSLTPDQEARANLAFYTRLLGIFNEASKHYSRKELKEGGIAEYALGYGSGVLE